MGDTHIFVMSNGDPIAVKKDGEAPTFISFPEANNFTVREAEEFMCNLIDAITKARELDNDPI